MREDDSETPGAEAQAAAQTAAERAAQQFLARDRGTSMLGCAMISAGPGRAVVHLIVEPRHLNAAEVCHGGIVFALADSALGIASCTHGEQTLAQQATITWLRPAHERDTLTATAAEVSRAGRSAVYDVTVVNQRGETVALFRGMVRSLGIPVGAAVKPKAE